MTKQRTTQPQTEKQRLDALDAIKKRTAAIEVYNQLRNPYRLAVVSAVASILLPAAWLVSLPAGMGLTMGAFGISLYTGYKFKQTRLYLSDTYNIDEAAQ